MEETLRVLVALGFGFLLVLLRHDADRFGTAEYGEPDAYGVTSPLFRRLAWYVTGIALIAGVYAVFPDPRGTLRLTIGDRTGALVGGLAFGALGVTQAAGLAAVRYRRLRLPPPSAYLGTLLNTAGTVVVDEAAFRGILLGLIVAVGVDGPFAVAIAALAYTLATRVGRRGGDPYLVILTLAIGLVGGWLTLETGGIAAAVGGHAITVIATFVATGHAGWARVPRAEPEAVEARVRPAGWSVVSRLRGGRAAEGPTRDVERFEGPAGE